jgi:hypothetical protein
VTKRSGNGGGGMEPKEEEAWQACGYIFFIFFMQKEGMVNY